MLYQLLWLFAILAVSLIFGFSPLLFNKFAGDHASKTKLIGHSNALSAGIFLGIAFFHLLPESTENFQNYFTSINMPKLQNYPFQFLFAFIAYALILFVEKVAFDSHSLLDHEHGDDHDHHEHADNHQHEDHSSHDGAKHDHEKEALNKNSKHRENDHHSDDHPALLKGKMSEDTYKNLKKEEAFFIENPEIKTPLIQNTTLEVTNEDNVIFGFDNKDAKSCNISPNKCLLKMYNLEDELEIGGYKVTPDNCSDAEEEYVKGIISKQGQFFSFMQARNLKSKNYI